MIARRASSGARSQISASVKSTAGAIRMRPASRPASPDCAERARREQREIAAHRRAEHDLRALGLGADDRQRLLEPARDRAVLEPFPPSGRGPNSRSAGGRGRAVRPRRRARSPWSSPCRNGSRRARRGRARRFALARGGERRYVVIRGIPDREILRPFVRHAQLVLMMRPDARASNSCGLDARRLGRGGGSLSIARRPGEAARERRPAFPLRTRLERAAGGPHDPADRSAARRGRRRAIDAGDRRGAGRGGRAGAGRVRRRANSRAKCRRSAACIFPFPASSKNPLAMALNVRRLARVLKSERVDLVHARSRAAAWVALGRLPQD